MAGLAVRNRQKGQASVCSTAAASRAAAGGAGAGPAGMRAAGGCRRRRHQLRRERDGAAASRSGLAASAEASLQSRSAAASPAAASPKLASAMESQALVVTSLASAMESGAPVARGRAKDGARSGGVATWASGSLAGPAGAPSQSKRAWPSPLESAAAINRVRHTRVATVIPSLPRR